jgi:hypothetical protein
MGVTKYPNLRKEYQYRKIPKSVSVEIPGVSSAHWGGCNGKVLIKAEEWLQAV